MRKLTLKKETVAELSASDLTSIVGGASGVKYCESLALCEYSELDTCLTWPCTR
ncbi:MAG TPA: class I lanthipeptide [Frankiaceae bacterium]|nr:class I lanthipeptide [Frankiaceae bacterium]